MSDKVIAYHYSEKRKGQTIRSGETLRKVADISDYPTPKKFAKYLRDVEDYSVRVELTDDVEDKILNLEKIEDKYNFFDVKEFQDYQINIIRTFHGKPEI